MKLTQKLFLFFIKAKLIVLSFISKKAGGRYAFKIFCTPAPPSTRKPAEIIGTGEKISFLYNNLPVNGFRYNHPQTKKVLILHGFSSSLKNFSAYISDFIENGFEVIAFDAPAHGKSPGKQINALVYAEVVEEIINKYGPIDFVMGHSFGGLAICLALEKQAVQQAKKIVLIAPATETTTALDVAFNFLKIKSRRIKESLHTEIELMSGKPTEWFSIRRAIRNISSEILWLHDEEDDTTPLSDALKVKNDLNKNVSFFISKGLGHSKIYRDAAVRKRVLNFFLSDESITLR